MIALVVLAAIVLYVIIAYNALTRLRMLANGAWADIDVQLKRRHDLVPRLVETVKGHTGYERGTIEAVVAARNRAAVATGPAASGSAEGELSGAVRQIFALAEAYPDLRAAESFLALQRSLTEIEDHIQNARRYYNAVVRDLNTRVAQFPSNMIAGPFGIGPREFFGLADATEAAAPGIGFGRTS